MTDRWRALWVLSAARVAMGFQFQAVGSTAPLLREQFGLSLADIGWLVGIYLLPGVVLALPGGLLSARFGDRRIAMAGMALMVAGGALSAFADSLALMEAGRLLGGMGGVLFNVTASKMIADWFASREIELAMAIFVGTWPLGIGLALLTLGPIAALSSPSVAFAATAIVAGVSLALIAAFYSPAPAGGAVARPRLSVLSPREWGLLGLAGGTWMFYNVAFAVLVSFVPTWLAVRGLPTTQAGALTAALSLVLIVSIPASGWLVDRIGHPLTIASIGVLGWCASMAALVDTAHPLLWLAVGGLLAGTAPGVMVATPVRFLSPAARAVGMGVFYTIFYAGMAVLPRGVGHLADVLGSAQWSIPAAIGMALASVALLWTTHGLIRFWQH